MLIYTFKTAEIQSKSTQYHECSLDFDVAYHVYLEDNKVLHNITLFTIYNICTIICTGIINSKYVK